MTRFLLLTAAASFGLTLLFFDGPEVAHAQTTRRDTIRFMAATQGTNFDGTGLKWCVSTGWHAGIPDNPNLTTALDEVPQTLAGCPRSSTEQVELAVYGTTNATGCTLSTPCESLRVRINSGVYPAGKCNFIEAWLSDYNTANENPGVTSGNFRGRERMLHARGPNGYGLTIFVGSAFWYYIGSNWTNVGTVVPDADCRTVTGALGWTDYHVHHDFMPPTTSLECQWDKNTSANFATGTTNLLRNDPNIWYIHGLTHTPGVPCIKPGPAAADSLTAPDGALDGDGNGAGTKDLATGARPSVTSLPTCVTGTSWCGTITVTPPVLQAAFAYYRGWSPLQYFRARQAPLPPPRWMAEWYNDGTAFFQVRNFGDTVTYPGDYYVGNCPYHADLGEPIYIVSFGSTALSCNLYGAGPPPYGTGVTAAGVNPLWAGFRGLNGVNPSAPTTQTEANTWTLTQIDSGHWWDVVQPALDAVIRAGASNMDMATLGITGNPPFDGDLGQVGMARLIEKMNTLASRIRRSFIF